MAQLDEAEHAHSDEVRQGVNAIDGHSRFAKHCCLENRCSGGQQYDISRTHCRLGVAIKQREVILDASGSQLLLDDRSEFRGRDRRHKMRAGPGLDQFPRRLRGDTTEPLHFTASAARQYGDYFLRVEAKPCADGCHVDNIRRSTCTGMPDENCIDAVLLIERWLERKNTQHRIGCFLYLLHTPRPPCPNRGAHVVCCLYSGLAELLFESEIKIRRIDTDEYIRG